MVEHRFSERWACNTVNLNCCTYRYPVKKSDDDQIVQFNRTFREDVLDAYLFSSLEEVRQIVEPWIENYNGVRPHEALQGLSPYQFKLQNA